MVQIYLEDSADYGKTVEFLKRNLELLESLDTADAEIATLLIKTQVCILVE